MLAATQVSNLILDGLRSKEYRSGRLLRVEVSLMDQKRHYRLCANVASGFKHILHITKLTRGNLRDTFSSTNFIRAYIVCNCTHRVSV